LLTPSGRAKAALGANTAAVAPIEESKAVRRVHGGSVSARVTVALSGALRQCSFGVASSSDASDGDNSCRMDGSAFVERSCLGWRMPNHWLLLLASLGLPLARLSCAISREVMVFVPLLVIAVSSWTPSLPSNGGGLIQRQRLRPLMSGASEQDEIAELESRLANLKKAQEEELAAAALAEAEASGKRIVEATEGFDPTTLSNRKRVATSSGPAPEELLSEAWKEIEEESRDGEGGLPLASLGGGLALLVGLFVFAQVPIGQELDPATYNTANVPLESSAKIRQRYESVGAVD
jgi:hypothetical protein